MYAATSRPQIVTPAGFVTWMSNVLPEPTALSPLPPVKTVVNVLGDGRATPWLVVKGPLHRRLTLSETAWPPHVLANVHVGFCSVESTTLSPLKSQAHDVGAGVDVSVNWNVVPPTSA